MAVDQHGTWHCNTLEELPRSNKGYFSEYQYDALERRVLVRARSDTNCVATDGSCYSTLTRTIYDGDQVLYEIQVPGGDPVAPAQLALDTTADTAVFHPYGRVVYTHGVGLDQPADVIRIGYSPSWPDPVVMVPHSTADGGYDVGSFVDGHLKECKNYAPSADSSCIKIDWPEQYYGPFFEDVATQYIPLSWFGSLIEGHRDASGQIFLRNRYYDPNTGRFTQEDPLGLAGGLNAYGYANGDPVDFSDPFGLTCLIVGNCTQADGGVQQAVAHEQWVQSAQGVVDDPGLVNPLLAVGGIEEKEGQAVVGVVEAASADAAEIAAAGGKHAGFLRNYASKSAGELEDAIGSLEKNVGEHLDWIQTPTKKVADFFSRSAEYLSCLS